MPLILIVEDELKLAEVLRDYLKRDGFEVTLLSRGEEVQAWLQGHQPSLILLDIMLPGCDGLTLCRDIRKYSATPIILTTARVEEIDRLLGLELGADEYICKPYSPREVVARVKAVLRRSPLNRQTEENTATQLVLADSSNQAKFGEKSVTLTAVEMRLLHVLMKHPGRIYSRDQLMDEIYTDRRLVNDRTIDSHIKNLRRKLTQLDKTLDFVHSVYGAGYKFD